jgi:hypothetical protein
VVERLLRQNFAGRLLELAQNASANFCVQRLLQRLRQGATDTRAYRAERSYARRSAAEQVDLCAEELLPSAAELIGATALAGRLASHTHRGAAS